MFVRLLSAITVSRLTLLGWLVFAIDTRFLDGFAVHHHCFLGTVVFFASDFIGTLE